MPEHVCRWMVSSVGGVYLAICNALDDEGNATCEAELTSNEIDARLNEYETLKKATEAFNAKYARYFADNTRMIALRDYLRVYADTLDMMDKKNA